MVIEVLIRFDFQEEVKGLVRGGIPHEYRARVWVDFVNHLVKHEKEAAGEGYFVSLLNEWKDHFTPAKKEIELDLLRTLPNNKYYDKIDSEGVRVKFVFFPKQIIFMM